LSGVLRQVWHARAEGNVEAVAAQGVQRVFGDGVDGRLMQLESRLWVYALMRRPAAAPFAGEQQFSAHRQNGNASNQLAAARPLAPALAGHGLRQRAPAFAARHHLAAALG
jgi:hypothetical protein